MPAVILWPDRGSATHFNHPHAAHQGKACGVHALEEYRAFEKRRDEVEREIHGKCRDCEFQWKPNTRDAALRCFVDADVACMPKGDWPALACQLRGYALLMKQIILRYLA